MTVTQSQFELSTEGAFAEIYTHENVTAQTVATGNGYTKITSYDSEGDSRNATNDLANSKLTITELGTYKAECSVSFTGAGVNINWFGSIFSGDTENDKIHFERKINTGGDYGATQIGGILVVDSVPLDVDFRVRHDDGSDRDITVRYSNLNATLVGV